MDKSSLRRIGFGDVSELLENNSYFSVPNSGEAFWTEITPNTDLSFKINSGSNTVNLNVNQYSTESRDLVTQDATAPSEVIVDYSKPFSKRNDTSFGFIDRDSLRRMGLNKITMTSDLLGIKYPETEDEHKLLSNTNISLITSSASGKLTPDENRLAVSTNISGFTVTSIF